MKIKLSVILFLITSVQALSQTPINSEFTYQGNLTVNGDPATGSFDFELQLFDASTAGTETGQSIVEDIIVEQGFFTVPLDFGDAVFSGNQVWMEISVREGTSTGGFQSLLPRQKINSTPYAIHAQFVGSNAIGAQEIQDGSITNVKIANNAVTTNKIQDGSVTAAKLSNDVIASFTIQDGSITTSKLADNSVTSVKVLDGSISTNDLSDNAVSTNKIQDSSITSGKIANGAVGSNQVDSNQVQLRVSGGCTEGQYISSINESGVIQCSDPIDTSAFGVCKTSSGANGIIINGVCLLDYDNSSTNNWSSAVNSCSALGGDLCSVSQYQAIRNNKDDNTDVFYSNRSVWTNNFSDNDGGSKTFAINSTDDPSVLNNYGYGCCGNILPEPQNSQATGIGGVKVTYLHTKEDTNWLAASNICTSMGSDLCTKSQYVALNDNSIFDANFRKATAEMSDNDFGLFDDVIGSNTSDNPSATDLFAYACCEMSTKPNNQSCPGTQLAGGLCVGTIHDVEDTNFFDAARTCHTEGA
ncbi:MAG: hypothetical protein AB8B80_04270, partial [Marinicellaceae bacterium]